MQKGWKVILSISILINLFLTFILLSKPNTTDSKVYTKKIDSLESVIGNLNVRKDSIRERIDTIEVFLDKVIMSYEEDRNVIVNNSIIEDYLFFSEYLKRNKERFDSIYNSPTTKGN